MPVTRAIYANSGLYRAALCRGSAGLVLRAPMLAIFDCRSERAASFKPRIRYLLEVFNWTLKIAVLRVTGRKIREKGAVRQLPGTGFNPHDVIPRLTVRVRWIS